MTSNLPLSFLSLKTSGSHGNGNGSTNGNSTLSPSLSPTLNYSPRTSININILRKQTLNTTNVTQVQKSSSSNINSTGLAVAAAVVVLGGVAMVGIIYSNVKKED
jgi:hypothetical protein